MKLKTCGNVFKNWPLGHAAFRVGGNVGPLIPFIVDAQENGFDDIMWTLDGYIKELTFLNVFVLLKSRYGNLELITPPDDGCIYNGSMRKSIIEMRDEIKADFDINPFYNEGRKGSFNIIER